MSRLGSGFGNIWRVIHFEYFFLLSDILFLLVSLLVPDHLQVLDLCFRSGRQSFFHTLFGLCVVLFELVAFGLVLDDVGLAHRKLGNGGFHFASQVSQPALELVDFL